MTDFLENLRRLRFSEWFVIDQLRGQSPKPLSSNWPSCQAVHFQNLSNLQSGLDFFFSAGMRDREKPRTPPDLRHGGLHGGRWCEWWCEWCWDMLRLVSRFSRVVWCTSRSLIACSWINHCRIARGREDPRSWEQKSMTMTGPIFVKSRCISQNDSEWMVVDFLYRNIFFYHALNCYDIFQSMLIHFQMLHCCSELEAFRSFSLRMGSFVQFCLVNGLLSRLYLPGGSSSAPSLVKEKPQAEIFKFPDRQINGTSPCIRNRTKEKK